MRRPPPLIVGGGPAGAAVAIHLAQAGFPARLLERSRSSHDVVCGGFLSGDTLLMLEALGIDLAELGVAPISRVRIFAGKNMLEADLRFRAVGLSRRCLDAALLAAAIRAGAMIDRGVTVSRLDAADRSVTLTDGTVIAGDAIFLATGKHEVRGLPRIHDKPKSCAAVGIRTALIPSAHLHRQLENIIEIHLFRDGYAGLLLQEDGAANLCLSLSTGRLAEAGGRPEALIDLLAAEAPSLADRVGSTTGKSAWSSVAGIPYGWRASGTQNGLFRLGDQAAVIASLAGDGMAVALKSAVFAADAYLLKGGDGAQQFQARYSRDVRNTIRMAELLRRISQTPYLAGPLVSILSKIPQVISRAANLTRVAPHQAAALP